MSCSNCFNNCTEITPDKCVRYTGADASDFEIQNGDTLLSVIQKLITYLETVLDGSGIQPIVRSEFICDEVSPYFEGTDLNAFVEGLMRVVCDLQSQINVNTIDLQTIEDDYDVDCLSGVGASDGTHDILQAVITKLCTIETALQALSTDLSTNYVALTDLNDLIQTYLDSTSSSLMKNKMVPYTAIPYFGTDLSMFAADGSGTGDWIEIYLCNGANGTPDMRGRVPVGATSTPGVLPMSSAVDPHIAGNPAYTVGDAAHGANTVTLSEAQMPQHTHTNTVSVEDNGHLHYTFNNDSTTNGTPITEATYPVYNENRGNNYSYTVVGTNTEAGLGRTSTETTGINVYVTNQNTGSSEAHNNIQPSIGVYYIMYIPSV